MGLRHQLISNAGRNPRRKGPQPLRRDNSDKIRRVGFCQLVNDGFDFPLGSVSA